MLRDIIHRTQKMLKNNFSILIPGHSLESYLRVEGKRSLSEYLKSDEVLAHSIPEYDVSRKPSEKAKSLFHSPYEASLFESYVGYCLSKALLIAMSDKSKGSCPSIGVWLYKSGDKVKVEYENATKDKK